MNNIYCKPEITVSVFDSKDSILTLSKATPTIENATKTSRNTFDWSSLKS